MRSPPRLRVARADKSCGNCAYFYVRKAWSGKGECILYDNHITDEDLVCDSHAPDDEQKESDFD